MAITFNNSVQLVEKIQRENLDLNDYLIGHEGYIETGDCKYYLMVKDNFSQREVAYNPERLAYVAAELLADIEYKIGIQHESYKDWIGTAEKIHDLVKNLKADPTSDYALATTFKLNSAQATFKSIQRMPLQLWFTQPPSTDNNIDPVEPQHKPLVHNGMSCFVNTIMQVIAHIPVFQKIVDPESNQLEQGPTEEPTAFQARQDAQHAIHAVVKGIKAGAIVDPAHVTSKINRALAYAKKSGQHSLRQGGDSSEMMQDIMQICGISYYACSHVKYVGHKLLADPSRLEKNMEDWRNKLNDSQAFPEVVILSNTEESPTNTYYPEINLEGVLYRLVAIEEGGTGHAIPWLRTREGTFAKLNDLSGRVHTVEAETAAVLLRQQRGWTQAHYMRVATE